MVNTRKPAIGFIFVTLLLDIIGFGIIIPIFPKFIVHLLGSDLSNASLYGGLLMFSFSIMQFLFSSALGCLSDRYGRRPVLLISLFGFGVNYLIVAFATNIFWLFVGRLLAGITGASFTTASAYVADVSTPEKRAQNFGIIGTALGLGFIIGPVMGGVLGKFGMKVPFIVAAVLTFLNWLYGYFFLPESLPIRNRKRFDIRHANPLGSLKMLRSYPVISGLTVSLVCVYISSFATQSTWTFFTMETFHWDESLVGYSLGLFGLLMAVVQGGLVRVINPWLGAVTAIYVGLAFNFAGLLMIAFAPKGWMLFVILIPLSLSGLANPAVQGIISNEVPANKQGELQGALASLMSITSILGPLLMNGLFSYFTSKNNLIYLPGAPFLMAAILVLVSAIMAQSTLASIKHKHRLKRKK